MLNFLKVPALGTVAMLDGQSFEVVGTRLHQRQDGKQTTLIDWRANCASCGVEYSLATGLKANSVNRRCGECRNPGKPVRGKRGRKVKVKVIAA